MDYGSMQYAGLTDLRSPASDIGTAGATHLVIFGLLIPFLVVRSRRRVLDTTRPLPPRLSQLQAGAFNLVCFAAFSILVARKEWIELFPGKLPSVLDLVAGIAMYVATVAFMRPRWRRAAQKRGRFLHFVSPANRVERVWWILVSTFAGIGEEITWRGVQTVLLFALLGSYPLATLVCAIMFGVAHWVQGWRSAAIICVFSLGFAGLVSLTGTLYVAMAVHVAYDITAGLTYGKLARELGNDAPAAPSPENLV